MMSEELSIELERIRLQKHAKLLKMIHSYKLAPQDRKSIEESKSQTLF